MSSEKDKLVLAISQQVLAYDYIIEADREAMLALISGIADSHGISMLDDLPLRTWFFQKMNQHLLDALVKIENTNSEAAAFIQSVIDETKLADDDGKNVS